MEQPQFEKPEVLSERQKEILGEAGLHSIKDVEDLIEEAQEKLIEIADLSGEEQERKKWSGYLEYFVALLEQLKEEE